MTNSNSSSKNVKSNITDDNNDWILGCMGMILVYALIIYFLFWLWDGVDAASVFDGTWEPTYP